MVFLVCELLSGHKILMETIDNKHTKQVFSVVQLRMTKMNILKNVSNYNLHFKQYNFPFQKYLH